jgi:hypothetical protein
MNISEKYAASICRMCTMNIKAADCSKMVIPSTKPHDIFQKSIIFPAPFLTEILFALVISSANTVICHLSHSP